MSEEARRFYETKPWLAHYDDGVPHHLDYPDANLPELFEASAKRHAGRVALRFMGRSVGYDELSRTATAIARRLRSLGVEAGDRVVLFFPNTPHFVACYLGVLQCGAVAVPASPLDTAPELEHKVRDSDAKVVFFLDLLYDRLEPLIALPAVKAFVAGDLADYLPFAKRLLFPLRKRKLAPKQPDFDAEPRIERYRDFVAAGSRLPVPEPVRRSAEDLAVILYTGGTTGVSKGVMLSHRALVVNQAMAGAWVGVEASDVFLAVLPLFHGFGLSVGLNLSMVSGLTLVLQSRFDPGAVLKDLVREDVTLFAGVPTMYTALVDHPRFGTLRNGKLRGCFVGAASAPERLKERFEAGSGSVLIEGYGLTEAVTAKTASPYTGTKKPLSVGLPWPDVEVWIVDPESGELLEAGRDGELLLRSPDLMSGYWNDVAATTEVLQDGWLRTGDIARIDEDGYLFIVDRKKDLIICGGHNVYPTEIEEHLAKLQEVKLCCVVGIADDYMGEVPKAFIVLQPGAELSTERARAYLEERLAKYKVPRHYEFRDELPTSPIGKVLRKRLRAEAGDAGCGVKSWQGTAVIGERLFVSKIARIELFHVAIPLPARFYPSWIPGFPQTENRFTLIKVTTDDGVEGFSAGPAMGKERQGLGELLGPYLIGEDATDIALVQQRLRECSYLGWRNFWVEPAFFDIKGKLAGQPVCRLLGAEPRTVKLYASTGELKEPGERIQEVLRRYEEGFGAVKLRVHDFDPAVDERQIVETAAAVGDKVEIGVDANQGWRVTIIGDAPLWDLGRAKRFADVCADASVAWLEEPLPMDRYDDLAALTAYSEVPIAGGELHTSGLAELRMMIERRCYDIFQPDATFTGGIEQTLAVAKLCRQHGLRYTPHTWTNGIGFAINLHLLVASGFAETEKLEYPISPPGWTVEARDRILTQPFVHDKGTIAIPESPGLGFEIDRKVLRRYGQRFFVMDRKRLVWFSVRRRGVKVSREIDRIRKSRRARATERRSVAPRQIR